MAVFSIWESYFPPEAQAEGLAATKAIWEDMEDFDGYVSHELIEDLDDPGHLLVVSRWQSREDADAALRDYAGHPNAERANGLVVKPRTRMLGRAT